MKIQTTKLSVLTGLYAALIMIMTAYICHIPYGVNGGYIHFGDAMIYLAAVTLPKPYAIMAAIIGGGLADLLTAPVWAPATIIIKMLLTLSFTSENGKILGKRNMIAPLVGIVFTVIGYYIAEGMMFGSFYTAAASAIGNIIQGIGSAIIFYILAKAFDKMQFKVKMKGIMYY